MIKSSKNSSPEVSVSSSEIKLYSSSSYKSVSLFVSEARTKTGNVWAKINQIKVPIFGQDFGIFFDFIKTFCNLYIPMSGGEQVIVFKSSMYVAAKIVYSTVFIRLEQNTIRIGVSLIDPTATTKVC